MKILLWIVTAIFSSGAIWFSRLTWIASQKTGTGYLGEFIANGTLAAVCIVAVIGFGIWAIFG